MAEFQQSLVINLEALGETVYFDITGFTVGSLQATSKDGAWSGAILDVVSGNSPDDLTVLDAPVKFSASKDKSPALDLSATYYGVTVDTPNAGIGTAYIVMRAFNS